MAIKKTQRNTNSEYTRYAIIALLAVAAFFGAYKFAQANSAQAQATQVAPTRIPIAANAATGSAAGGSGSAGSSSSSGSGCCGGGASGASGGSCCGGGGAASTSSAAGRTTIAGGVQTVTIDLTGGSYSPNQITAKAGIPIDLVFKGPASGCNGTVVSQQLGFQQDVSNGGTIKVGALKPGTYQWTCGMGMYIGRIVVQ